MCPPNAQERGFIWEMRRSAAHGVGYGWMQQVIEWEWQSTGTGAWGPELHDKWRREYEARIEALEEVLRNLVDEWDGWSAGDEPLGDDRLEVLVEAARKLLPLESTSETACEQSIKGERK